MSSRPKIDSIYDFSDKGLVEVKAWLEPWFKTDPAAVGGGGEGGIDFNKENSADQSGAAASYLWLRFVGSSPYAEGTGYGDLSYFNEDTGTGSQLIRNDGGGYIALRNTGDGVAASTFTLSSGDGDPDGGGNYPLIGLIMQNDGAGASVMKATQGHTEISNHDKGIRLWSSGHDLNGVSVKVDLNGDDFLIEDHDTITRDGSHNVTGYAPVQEMLRLGSSTGIILTPFSGTYIQMVGLPTSSPGGTGRVWNSSGVLHIT